jgi:hypothetical protein
LLARCAGCVDQLRSNGGGREFRINSSGVGGEEDELVNAARMLQSKGLGDKSAHRPTEHAHTFELERLDYVRGVVRELVDIEWRAIISGSADAAVVEEDELVGRRQAFDERRIPIGAGRGQPIENQQRSPAPKPMISDSSAIDRDCPYRIVGHQRPSKKALPASNPWR